MSLPDQSIDPKILKSAKEEFLAKGFVDASLREMCKKAGVTTGALYKRFSGKDALFEAVVSSTLSDIEKLTEEVEQYDYKRLDQNDMQAVWDMSEETLRSYVIFIYEHFDGLKLLLCCSEGSGYSNFLHDFVTEHSKRTITFANAAFEKGFVEEQIDKDEVHMLMTAFWSTLFEPVIHGYSKEKALHHCSVVAKFFNWQAVFGF